MAEFAKELRLSNPIYVKNHYNKRLFIKTFHVKLLAKKGLKIEAGAAAGAGPAGEVELVAGRGRGRGLLLLAALNADIVLYISIQYIIGASNILQRISVYIHAHTPRPRRKRRR